MISPLVDSNSARLTVMMSGASGMLGVAVRQSLAARAATVRQLVRHTPTEPNQLLWDPGASPALPDRQPLEGLDAAIHLSGSSLAAHRWTAAYKRELVSTRVQSTRNLVATLLSLRSPPAVLLCASAVGFYGDRGNDLLDERAAPGSGFLAELCQEWEAASHPATDAGIRVVHLRFGVVLGPHGGALDKMLPLFRYGLGGRLGSGLQWMSWISLADLVAAALFALDNPRLSGPVNFTAPHPVTNAEFTHALAHTLHRPAVFPAPAFALRVALGEMADAALLSSTRAIPAKLTDAGFRFTHPTIDLALNAALRARQ